MCRTLDNQAQVYVCPSRWNVSSRFEWEYGVFPNQLKFDTESLLVGQILASCIVFRYIKENGKRYSQNSEFPWEMGVFQPKTIQWYGSITGRVKSEVSNRRSMNREIVLMNFYITSHLPEGYEMQKYCQSRRSSDDSV
ncbi:hypothetical protein TNCT_391421 [Trichonephila clavata]|uniref:Uncharacterized protein n=1 Tax=Trichonephila clavata TaxID=2740835 RepID=A0A8X6LNY7_TRICU|nr:hypothetical protein TNCT_391421 [Trichonephila clavata]